MKEIEILAPAGNLEKLEIAYLYGADAAYIGGKDFSLRSKAGNFSLEEIRILEISSKSPLKLLEETIHELDTYLDRFFLGIEEIVLNFRIGKREEGISNLIEGINGLDWIFQILRKSQELLDIDDENLEKIYIESNDVLLRLTEAVEEKKYDAISIILDFDLYMILSQIKEFVPVIFELLKVNDGNDILFN